MSLQKFVIVNAVPFGLARLQSNVSKTVLHITGGRETTDNNDYRVVPRIKNSSNRIAHAASARMINKRKKLFHNNSLHASQEKLKLQRGLLEQHLLDVKAEKMKLILENEDLKLRCSSLEEENNLFRMKLLTSRNYRQDEGNQMCGETLKQASLVSTPRLKDWVLPQIFTLLMITLGEVLHNFQPKQLLTFQFIYHKSKHWIKSLTHRPWQMMQMFLLSLCLKASPINQQVQT